MTSNLVVSFILLAGGKGTRMGTELPKQYLPLNGKPLALYSLEVFLSFPAASEVIVVCDLTYRHFFSAYPVKFALPGERRQDSLINGLKEASLESPWICSHDAARPFINHTMIHRLFDEGKKAGAATVGMPVKYTVKLAKEDNYIMQTLQREQVWEIQTPQFQKREILMSGIQIANEQKLTVTDDISFAELANCPAKLVKGSHANLKITTPEDLAIAEQFLKNNYLASS